MPSISLKGQIHLYLIIKMSYLFKGHWNKGSGSFTPCKPQMQPRAYVCFPGGKFHHLVLLCSIHSLSQACPPPEVLSHRQADRTFPKCILFMSANYPFSLFKTSPVFLCFCPWLFTEGRLSAIDGSVRTSLSYTACIFINVQAMAFYYSMILLVLFCVVNSELDNQGE